MKQTMAVASFVRSIVPGAGRYEVERELARGGMGAVYRVRDRATGLVLALKRSLGEHDGKSADQRRLALRREYQTLAALSHPHIIRVYDFGVDEQGPYYTMELLEGADLRAKCPMPWRDVCAHLRDVASSLALLHSRRLLHCDVSVANIWLTRENRAMLLDFGALASFGRNANLVGAPPTTAPEVLAGEELDQRVDLYALGASAYYALTGSHAYPAALLALLPAMWARGRPAPPSAYVPDIPPELDALVLSLLEHDRILRPSSAAQLIDQLEVIAGLTPDRDPRVVRSYLQGAAVVGRDATRRVLADKLKRALAGRASFVLIEGASGLGKSFLLADLEQQARLAGARVLSVHARAHSGAFGVWSALFREAGLESTDDGKAPLEKVTEAVRALEQLAGQVPLVVAIEDLHEADTDSLAALLSLAKSWSRAGVLLAVTLDGSHPQAARPALHLLRSRFTPVSLAPLDDKATQAFVMGLFGAVPSAARLATFLYEHGAGNPQTYRAVIDLLIAQGVIRYVDGIWVLPTEMPAVGPSGLDLTAVVGAAVEGRIAHLGAPLCCLAQCLSPNRRPFDRRLCELLAAVEPALEGRSLDLLLGELVREGVLLNDQGTYTFARQAEQEHFYTRLGDEQRQALHLRLGEDLERRASADGRRIFEIGLHFLRAGRLKKARAHLNRNVEHALRDPDMLIQSVPDLWALLKQQRQAGASDEEVQFIEGMLVLAGYYVDPTVYDAFGERVLRIMHRSMGFALATRLSRWLGNHLALVVGMLTAWVKSLFRQPYLLNGGSFSASVLTFIGVCVSMNAGACVRFERKVYPLLFELLEVTGKLGRLNALRFLYDQFKMGEDFARGHMAKGRAGLFDQLERLPKLPLLAGESEHQLEVGLLFSLGLNSIKGYGSDVLELADRIDAMGGKHDRLQAQFLRQQYHFFRGDLAAAKREEDRFDEMSAQLGSRWTMDVHGAFSFSPYHLTADVLGLKRALHRMEILLPTAPGLATSFAVARAMYEGHRGRPDLALQQYAELGERIAPFADPIWASAVGHKAECLNTLGRHVEALAVCEEARKQLSDADRAFVFLCQQIERERALALAGLGRFAEAIALSDQLLTESAAADNPLIRGFLHFDRARIAKQAQDTASFEEHAQAAQVALTATKNPAAIARVNRLLGAARRRADVGAAKPAEERSERLRQLVDPTRRGKAERLLEEVMASRQVQAGRLYLMVYGKPVLCAQRGPEVPDGEAEAELSALSAALERDFSGPVSSLGTAPLSLGTTQSSVVIPLVSSQMEAATELVALLVLSEDTGGQPADRHDLGLLAEELLETEDATEAVYGDKAES